MVKVDVVAAVEVGDEEREEIEEVSLDIRCTGVAVTVLVAAAVQVAAARVA